jgi:flagellar assembly protein FliH
MSDAAATLAATTRKWEVPSLTGPGERGFLTAGRLEELQKTAHDEAWAVGHAEGLKAGGEELRRRAARLDQLLNALARPFDLLDDTVEKQLVELAITMVRQLFRRELKSDPGSVIGVVREAIKLLPVAARNIKVQLHPEDAALVRESLSHGHGERAWNIVEDPLMSRGGCTVTTDCSRVDAQAEARLKLLVDALSGDDRR